MTKSVILILLISSVFTLDVVEDQFIWPEWPEDYGFKTWSGLIQLTDDGGVERNLHYVFLESQSEDAEIATQPIVLWLNGGPGCSSLLGLMQEIGPYVIDNGETTYVENPWSWNKNAHLLFLEAPFGVGFSQPSPDEDYIYTDEKTGLYNYQAIRKWFDTFTYYRGRDFWIAGESYAGMYIPYTAQALLANEVDVEETEKINFKGILIGNGVLVQDSTFRQQTSNKYLARRSFVDPTNQFILLHNCKLNPSSASCKRALTTLDKVTAEINPYNIYGYCWGDSTNKQFKKERKSKHRFQYTPWIKLKEDDDDDSSAPCIDFGPLANKLNTDTYKQAFHVDETTIWEGCSDSVYLQYQKNPNGSYQLIPELFQAGLKILIYSGDQDLAVSTVETQESLKLIPGIDIINDWTAIKNEHDGQNKDQLVGWLTEYNYLSFYVIRGAGHMVPQEQRENSWYMFNDFINA